MGKMLTSLFKPAWQSRSIEKRLKAIAEMDCNRSEDRRVLSELARSDENVSVRLEAIDCLIDVDVLHELSQKDSADDIRQAAEKRINELISSRHILDEEQYFELLKCHPGLELRIAAFADSSSVREKVISNLSSAQLLEVLSTTVFTDSRRHIAEKLSDIDDLESARKILRGKDKNAERIIKAKIDAVRTHQRQQAENRARVEKLIEDAEYLAGHDWLPEFKSRCTIHRQQWGGLDFDVDENERLRYQAARDVIDTKLEQQRVIDETRQSQQRLYGELEALIQMTAGSDLAGMVEAQLQTLSQLQKIRSEWQALAEISPPDEAISEPYEKMCTALQKVTQFVVNADEVIQNVSEDPSNFTPSIKQLDTALEKLEWPAGLAELRVEAELKQQLLDWREAQQSSADEYQQKLDRAHKNINSIFRFSRAGNLVRAKQIAEKAEKALGHFGGKDLLALQERFKEAAKTLGDMGDWKNFATEPKYIELCEVMEQLIDSGHHPDKRSSQMKTLQQQWKSLGYSDISEQYWPRFKLAADKVYQPCAEYFEQRRKARKVNLEQRQQFVEKMHELLETTDWDNSPDYKEAQSRLHSINSGFTGIKDVEHKPGQKQWKQYSTLKDAVMTKLDNAYDENITQKQQLIKQAETLAEASAKIENLSSLKSLQARWNQVGITRRKDDQKAWPEFKKHCDIVYNSAQSLRQGQREETDQQLNAYREVIKALQTLAKKADDLAKADQQFSALQTEYNGLPELPLELPEKLVAGINRDYLNACEQYDNCRSRIIKSRHKQQLEALRQKASLCTQLEALAASASEQQLQEISQQWDSIELHNAELSRRIEVRRDSARSSLDRVVIGAERRMLCIQLEIAMSVESPHEDRDIRMQYQLEQMNKSGLGQAGVDSKQLIENMELDWLCMPGAEVEQQKVLDERFWRVLQNRP